MASKENIADNMEKFSLKVIDTQIKFTAIHRRNTAISALVLISLGKSATQRKNTHALVGLLCFSLLTEPEQEDSDG